MKKAGLVFLLFILGVMLGYYIAEGNVKHIISDTVKTFKVVQSYFINDEQRLSNEESQTLELKDGNNKDENKVNNLENTNLSQENKATDKANNESQRQLDTKQTPESSKQTTETSKGTSESSKLIVYYGDKMAVGVIGYEYTVDNDKVKDIQYIFELLKNTPDKELVSMIPKSAKLLSGRIENGTCVLDLTEEFISGNNSGSAGELITLDSIVNTYTELDGVNKVQFLIEGEKRAIFLNSVFDKPFVRNESSIINK